MAQYYLNTASTGTGDGTTTATTGDHAAWAAFSEISGEGAGDIISLNTGDTWRVPLTVPSSGSSGSPITYNAYGEGADPIINSSAVYSSWTGEGEVVIIDEASTAAQVPAFNIDGRTWMGQSDWVAGDDYVISAVEVQCHSVVGGFSEDVVAEVYNVDGVALGTLVAGTATSTAQAITTGGTYKFVGLAAEVSSGNSYSIVIRRNDSGNNAAVYPFIHYDNAGDSWSGQRGQWFSDKSNGGKFADEMGLKVYAIPSYATYTTEPNQVFWDGDLMVENVTSKATLATGEWWNDTVNDRIYVYDNPSGHTIEGSTYSLCIQTNNQSYLTFDGLNLIRSNGHNVWIDTASGRFDDIIVQNCTIEQAWSAGIAAGIGGYGDTGEGVSSGLDILDNTFINNGLGTTAQSGNGWCVRIAGNGPDDYIKDVLVQGNTTDGDAYGFKADWFSNDITLKGNYMECVGTVFSCDGGRDITWEYNIIDATNANLTDFAFSIFRWEGAPGPPYGFAVDNCKVLNNVMYGYKKGVSLADDQVDTIVKNNIFHSDFSDNIPVWMEGGETRAGLDIDNNCYYTGAHAPVFTISAVATYNYAEWQALGHDANSVNADPTMTDPASDNFILLSGSPCINTGTPVYALNIVENHNFEQDDDWVDYGTSPTHARGDSTVHAGTYSWEVLTGDANSGIQADTDVYGTITSGKTYEVSVWIYCSGGDTTATYGLAAESSGVLSTMSSTEALTNGNWSQATFSAPCTTTGTARPFVSVVGEAWAFIVDNFTISERLVLDYAGNAVTALPNIGAYEDFPGITGGGELKMTMGMWQS